jgi:hypothetical protein
VKAIHGTKPCQQRVVELCRLSKSVAELVVQTLEDFLPRGEANLDAADLTIMLFCKGTTVRSLLSPCSARLSRWELRAKKCRLSVPASVFNELGGPAGIGA